jgi:hypothetical protein
MTFTSLGMTATSADVAAPLPIACTLTDEERGSREGEVDTLFARMVAVRELPDGYAFAFPPEDGVAHAVFDLVLAERACCPFMTFDLAFPSPHERVWLHIGGGKDVKEFVRGSFLLHVPADAARE